MVLRPNVTVSLPFSEIRKCIYNTYRIRNDKRYVFKINTPCMTHCFQLLCEPIYFLCTKMFEITDVAANLRIHSLPA